MSMFRKYSATLQILSVDLLIHSAMLNFEFVNIVIENSVETFVIGPIVFYIIGTPFLRICGTIQSDFFLIWREQSARWMESTE